VISETIFRKFIQVDAAVYSFVIELISGKESREFFHDALGTILEIRALRHDGGKR